MKSNGGKSSGWRQLLRDRNVRWLYAGQIVNGITAAVSMGLLPWCYRLAKQSSAQHTQSLRRAS